MFDSKIALPFTLFHNSKLISLKIRLFLEIKSHKGREGGEKISGKNESRII